MTKNDKEPSSLKLAQFLTDITVPAQVRDVTRRYLLDWIGSAVAGGSSEPATMARSTAAILGGHPVSTILADGSKTSAPLAAFCNATAAHVVEMDDLDRTSITHPAAPVIAAALALGEQYEASGDEVLDAIAIGYEVCIRVGEALGPAHYEYWHTTGTAGTSGAAAAAARILKLPTETALHTLGSAGTMAAGLWEFLSDGAMSKQLHPAKAAHDGVLAALLSREGFTAASQIFEGKKGLLNAMSSSPRVDLLTKDLTQLSEDSSIWKINFVSFKVHSSCRHTHAAVDGAISLASDNKIDIDDVKSVEVEIYSQALGLLEGVEPISPWAAKFSLPFCVATALRYRDCSPSRFTDTTITDPHTLALAQKINFRTSSRLDEMYPEAWPSVVKISLRNGVLLQTQVDFPAGDPETDISSNQLSDKFRLLTQDVLGERTDRLIESIFDSTKIPEARKLATLVASNSATSK
jgi:2-methylcitrate dehydratase PrpD|tara:strand:+ start:5961 stop:7355 length:1395 start_codon:yes stop_codon:yes gene_type:complete